ncbi:uncharacterized protein LOC116343350 [Contarinia nasturtii]|uniref:uncharacterized protein LOC116343350 n=1 Tax=Contarinia nasturtii TaxID=265458 RepID=UPI0012D4703F|nr:uncharacterized protein LOC116343350 [Contarinia nasturtii]
MFKSNFIIFIFIALSVLNTTSAKPKADKGKGVASSSYDTEKIWSKFNATNRKGNKMVEYQIRNIPSTRFEEALSLMDQFMEDEPINDDEGESYFQVKNENHWRSVLNNKMSVACFDDEDKMVGLALLHIGRKKGSKNKRGRPVDITLDLLNVDIFTLYGVEEYLGNDGLIVSRKYRRRGIARQFLMIGKDICAEYGLEAAATVVTSDTVNKIATDLGFQLNTSINYDDDLTITLRSIKFEHK